MSELLSKVEDSQLGGMFRYILNVLVLQPRSEPADSVDREQRLQT